MKKNPPRIIFFLLILKKLIFPSDKILLKASNIVYDKNQEVVYALDNVELSYKDFVLRTNSLQYDITNNIVNSSTDTIVVSSDNFIFLNNFSLNLNTTTIHTKNFSIFLQPYYGYSERCSITENKYILEKTKITHCDAKNPHYYFSSNKVIIYPGKKIDLFSPIFVVGKLPIFWLPYYSIGLKPRSDCLILEPGNDSYNGVYLKVNYSFPLSVDSKIKFFLDYFSLQGIGVGSEYKYFSDIYSGVVYGYYIQQKTDRQRRWNILINDERKIYNLWRMQTNLEFISDDKIYFYYDKLNWFLTKKELNSSISFVRDTNITNLRISYLRNDIFSQQENVFKNNYFILPISYTIYPKKVGVFNVSNKLNFTNRFFEMISDYDINLNNVFDIVLALNYNRFSIAPKFIYEINLNKTNSFEENLYNTYGFSFPIRYNIGFFGYTDISYDYSIKSNKNSFSINFSTSSIIKNNLSMLLNLSFFNYSFRLSTMYNFLNSKNIFIKNFSPIVTDFGISIRSFNVSLHTEYDMDLNTVNNFQSSVGYNRGNASFSFTYGNNSDLRDIHFIGTNLNFPIDKKWKVKINILGNFDNNRFQLLSSLYEIYRDLHCWQSKLSYSTRSNVQEFWGYIGFKFGDRQNIFIDRVSRQYFPWRD